MFKQTTVTCLVFLFIISSAIRLAAQTEIVQQQPAIDSDAGVSASIPVKKNYDDDSKSWYAVYTKGNTIHVYLSVTDPLQQRKIITNGMEL